ncbi:hypothetical protein [Aeromonas salmonicida]|uniref:hypothetical protein n=1 Tax=Aeromonas salmonicida TaxID=645 RepID=UPI00366EECA1
MNKSSSWLTRAFLSLGAQCFNQHGEISLQALVVTGQGGVFCQDLLALQVGGIAVNNLGCKLPIGCLLLGEGMDAADHGRVVRGLVAKQCQVLLKHLLPARKLGSSLADVIARLQGEQATQNLVLHKQVFGHRATLNQSGCHLARQDVDLHGQLVACS